MKNKFIIRLLLLVAVSISLYSCVHDDLASSSDPISISSTEYTNKSLWKEDEVYIKNVKRVFEEYADKDYFMSNFGIVSWDHALTGNTFDESYLEAPVIKNNKVSFILVAYREDDRVYFKRKEERGSNEFFNVLVFKDRKQLTGRILDGSANNGTASKGCITTEVTWTWTNDDGSAGPTYVYTDMICSHSGPYLPCQAVDINTPCSGTGGGGGGHGGSGGGSGYPYPQQNQDPCTKTKSMLNKASIKPGINAIKAQALQTLSNMYAGEIGFKEKKDGTLAPADVNSAHQVVFSDVTDSYGGYHNHTANGTHMLSPPDIQTLLGFAAAQSVQDGVGNAYFGMIAGEWCNTCPSNVQYIHYIIQYTGAAADLGTGGNHVYTPAQIKQFENKYRIKVRELTNTSLNGNTYIKNSAGDLNEKGLEKLFFETLNSMNLNGKVNLQRVEANGAINNVTLDSNGIPTGTPCPN